MKEKFDLNTSFPLFDFETFEETSNRVNSENEGGNDVPDLGNPKEPCSGDKSISDLIFDIDESLLLKSSELCFDFSSLSEGEPKELAPNPMGGITQSEIELGAEQIENKDLIVSTMERSTKPIKGTFTVQHWLYTVCNSASINTKVLYDTETQAIRKAEGVQSRKQTEQEMKIKEYLELFGIKSSATEMLKQQVEVDGMRILSKMERSTKPIKGTFTVKYWLDTVFSARSMNTKVLYDTETQTIRKSEGVQSRRQTEQEMKIKKYLGLFGIKSSAAEMLKQQVEVDGKRILSKMERSTKPIKGTITVQHWLNTVFNKASIKTKVLYDNETQSIRQAEGVQSRRQTEQEMSVEQYLRLFGIEGNSREMLKQRVELDGKRILSKMERSSKPIKGIVTVKYWLDTVCNTYSLNTKILYDTETKTIRKSEGVQSRRQTEQEKSVKQYLGLFGIKGIRVKILKQKVEVDGRRIVGKIDHENPGVRNTDNFNLPPPSTQLLNDSVSQQAFSSQLGVSSTFTFFSPMIHTTNDDGTLQNRKRAISMSQEEHTPIETSHKKLRMSPLSTPEQSNSGDFLHGSTELEFSLNGFGDLDIEQLNEPLGEESQQNAEEDVLENGFSNNGFNF